MAVAFCACVCPRCSHPRRHLRPHHCRSFHRRTYLPTPGPSASCTSHSCARHRFCSCAAMRTTGAASPQRRRCALQRVYKHNHKPPTHFPNDSCSETESLAPRQDLQLLLQTCANLLQTREPLRLLEHLSRFRLLLASLRGFDHRCATLLTTCTTTTHDLDYDWTRQVHDGRRRRARRCGSGTTRTLST